MHKIITCAVLVLLGNLGRLRAEAFTAITLPTVAESSDFQATSTYDDVMRFCRRLAESDGRVQLTAFGESTEGRALPMLIVSKDGLTNARDAKLPSVLCMGNIHAGEVCGKEALLMLVRDLLAMETVPLLEHFVLLVVPIYNADGNERFSKDNRPGQLGPIEGMGQRENAKGLDLNRDFIKAEARETQALLGLLNTWDPAVVIDTHTTNGSQHRYTLTYDGPRHPATAPEISDYLRNSFFPKVSEALLRTSGYDSFYYGNFAEDHTRWESYPALPRYGAHYIGLRQRIAILSEAYAYAPYRDRVLATKAFVNRCLSQIVEDRDFIATTLETARNPIAKDTKIALNAHLVPIDGNVTVKGYIETENKIPKDYDVEHWAGNRVTRRTKLPQAYVIDAEAHTAVETLQRHGIIVEELREDIELPLQVSAPLSLIQADATFQGHRLLSIQPKRWQQKQRVMAGTRIVRVNQPLGKLAAYMLEPEAEDGLFAWGAFGESVRIGEPLPVRRLTKEIALLTSPLPALESNPPKRRHVTFDSVYGEDAVSFGGNPTSIRWLNDGKSFVQTREGKKHTVIAKTGRATPNDQASDLLKESLTSLPVMDEETIASLSKQRPHLSNPSGTAGLFTFQEDLYYLPFDGEPAVRLTATQGEEELAEFSPDGQFVAFVRAQNLYVVDVATQREVALTSDGKADIVNGKADWIYFEELYNRDWKAFWWSPDSRHIAFHRFDDSRLPLFHALNSLPLHGDLQSMRHPKAGDPNPDVQLGVVHIAGGPTQWMDLSNYTPGSYLISAVAWTPSGKQLYYYVQNRIQTWLDVCLANPTTGVSEHLFRDQTKAWVESLGELLFLNDDENLIIFLSERSGYRHFYQFDKTTKEIKALTSGNWDVRNIVLQDSGHLWLYFTATKDSSIAENLYRCHFDGSGLERLTHTAGHHSITMDPSGRYYVDTHSRYGLPGEVSLYQSDGTLIRCLDTNPVHERARFDFGDSELCQVPARDGLMLEAILTYPPDFDASKTYPVWFTTYGGPSAPTVRDAWSGGWVNDQLLAHLGAIVFRLDPRSASANGAQSAWKAYKQLGVQELEDIRDGIEWLKRKPYIDGARIGMNGHSYGGFMTAFAMTHSDLFCAGISGAPVTDWRYYDSIYTERYMDTPQNNPEGYAKTSVVTAAKNLHGRLLLLHGLMDDNVHLQNSTQFIKALHDADKDFEIMVYPEMKHGLHGAHYRRLLIDFITDTLGLQKD